MAEPARIGFTPGCHQPLSLVLVAALVPHLYNPRAGDLRGRQPRSGRASVRLDVDWWFLWSSTQQVGCATTDINGDFSITFRWCCGWWPWWWWRSRAWRLDPGLVERVNPILEKIPRPDPPPLLTDQPSLSYFKGMVSGDQELTSRALTAAETGALEGLRPPLLKHLPASLELENLHVWPWWPWRPWWDCTPDIIFKVTQDCVNRGEVILDETIGDTRWNISNPLNVVLVAGENACCRAGCQEPPCVEGECLVIDGVCGIPIDQIGGNLSAPASPAGYAYPGAVLPGVAASNGDRPFAETINVTKNPGDLLGIDYYEIEVFSGGTWNPLPAGAEVGFQRNYWDTATASTGWANFPFTSISGHNVCETREHYETGSGLTWDFPGADRWWLSYNFSTLVPLDTTKFADDTYSFRVVGWQLVGGALANPVVIPVCGTETENNLILTFDNRVVTPVGHPAAHNCGPVHICTLEPDTHISAVRINGSLVGPCDTVTDTEGTVEIDFMVTDPGGHLAYYSLNATYGLNQSVNLSQPARFGSHRAWHGNPGGSDLRRGLGAGSNRSNLGRWELPPYRAVGGGFPRSVLLPAGIGGLQAHHRRLQRQLRSLEPDRIYSRRRGLLDDGFSGSPFPPDGRKWAAFLVIREEGI